MAIDSTPYPEATDLANEDKLFYPVHIPVSHWQLRHYISAPEADTLYYASGHDVFCLNTRSKKRRHIATLPFESRCTASGYGWICVGGEEGGHFAAIKVGAGGQRTLDVDSALPIDSWRQVGPRNIKVERIGEQIVNSISIHRIQDEEAHLDDIVAILTNNDKTVRVYSLPQGLETKVLDLPFAMNHATVSPDGQTLVAVGDYNQAYFFCRDIHGLPPQIPKPHNRLTSSSIDWVLTNVVDLHVVSGLDPPRGYFTTAWSPNGQLVALGSEGGYITVFDVDMLADADCEDDDAVVAVVPSSRADVTISHAGAVRSMTFSPDPWDLLIWAEDQGRICIADLRTGLRRKQVVHLEPKEAGLKMVTYEDVHQSEPANARSIPRDIDEVEADFVSRSRQVPHTTSSVDYAAEYIEARRRHRQQQRDLALSRPSVPAFPAGLASVDDDPQGLTAQEQQILESLRTTRQREEARANGQPARTVTYTSANMFATNAQRSEAPSSNLASSSSRPADDIIEAVPDSFPELSRARAASGERRPESSHGSSLSSTMFPRMHNSHDSSWASARTSNLTRLSDGSRLPRRRASIFLSPSSSALSWTSSATQTLDSIGHEPNRTTTTTTTTTTTGEAGPSTLAADDVGGAGVDETGGTSETTTSRNEDDENPWATIEEFVSLARGPLFETMARARASSPFPATAQPASDDDTQPRGSTEVSLTRLMARTRDRWRTSRAEVAASTNSEALGTERRLATFPEGYDILLRRPQLRSNSNRQIGVRTAGLAMSPDGRTLWAACEEGIFEMQLNLKSRMFWPAAEPL